MTTSDIEQEICAIFGITPNTETQPQPRKRGRKPLEKQPIWSLNFYEPTRNITYAVISMCIKEDYDQSLDELATRLSKCKGRSKSECLRILTDLKNSGKLGYYDDYTLRFHIWEGEI